MGSPVLNESSTVLCTHGGQASTSSAQSSVKVDGSAVLVLTDTTTVAGCAFVLVSSPSPCVTVKWVVAATRVKVKGKAVLTSSAVGLAQSGAQLAQGTAQIANTQSRVKAT